MQNSKRSKTLLGLIIALSTGCQSTKGFKITSFEKDELHIVEIDSNRIIQECHFMNATHENNWRHQYILNMLNEQNEVIQVFNPTNQGKLECLAHLKKVEKILKNTSHVKLCVRDELKRDVNNTSIPETHDFGPLGRHESPYDALTFDTICNAKECYSISETWNYTCPNFKK